MRSRHYCSSRGLLREGKHQPPPKRFGVGTRDLPRVGPPPRPARSPSFRSQLPKTPALRRGAMSPLLVPDVCHIGKRKDQTPAPWRPLSIQRQDLQQVCHDVNPHLTSRSPNLTEGNVTQQILPLAEKNLSATRNRRSLWSHEPPTTSLPKMSFIFGTITFFMRLSEPLIRGEHGKCVSSNSSICIVAFASFWNNNSSKIPMDSSS